MMSSSRGNFGSPTIAECSKAPQKMEGFVGCHVLKCGRYCKSSPLQVGQRNPEANDFRRVLLFPDGSLHGGKNYVAKSHFSFCMLCLSNFSIAILNKMVVSLAALAGCQVKLVHFLEITPKKCSKPGGFPLIWWLLKIL